MNARAASVFAVLGWAVALAVFVLPIVSPDVFWHLSAARFMLREHAWPRADWLSYTMQGRPWIDFEWLCQLIWWTALRLAGWWGLVVLKAAVFTLAAFLLWRMLDLYELSVEGKTLSLLAWAVAWIPLNDLRPENFSVLCFTLQLWFLEARRLGRKTPFNVRLLPVLYVVWANLHAGFLYGLILVAIYGAMEAWRGKGAKASWALAGWGVACVAATFVNPYGWGLHYVLFEHARDMSVIQSYITEWQEPYLFNPWLIPFWALMMAAMTTVFSRFIEDRKVPGEHWLALAFFSYSAASHARLVIYLALVAVPVMACHIGHVYWAKKSVARVPAIVVCAALLAGYFFERMGPTLALRTPFIGRYVPGQTIRFIQENRATLAGHHMFNPWQWGGYLGYLLYPDLKVFVDGRYLFHPLIEPMLKAKESPDTYRDFMDRYGVDLVLLRAEKQMYELPVPLPGGKKPRVERPFFVAFLPEKDWAMVYWSREGFIFVRRAKFPASWVNANEYKVLRPDDFQAIELLVKSGAVPRSRLLSEYERLSRWSPDVAREPWYEHWVKGLAS